MTFYDDGWVNIYQGHVLDVLEKLEPGTVQCVVTSPPYWGLRRYKGEQETIWGGKTDCRHEWATFVKHRSTGGPQVPQTKWQNNLAVVNGQRDSLSNTCSLCGAWRGAFGSEPDPESYIAHSIEILRAIRRVLKDNGTVWWNLGDSMASGKGTCFNPGGGDNSIEGYSHLKEQSAYPLDRGNKSTLEKSNLKPLDCCLIPFRFALAAQQDGWYVRRDIIWQKNNPMPESVAGWSWQKHRIKTKSAKGNRRGISENPMGGISSDKLEWDTNWQDCPGCPKCSPNDGLVLRKGAGRCTDSHEYIFHLAKTNKYFYDSEAVREKAVYPEYETRRAGKNHKELDSGSRTTAGLHWNDWIANGGRNLRDVWQFPTQSFPGAHFATFPEELPRRCILAATSDKGNCSKCGAPWVRVIEKKSSTMNIRVRDAKRGVATPEEGYKASESELSNYGKETIGEAKTLGFRPSCSCNAPSEPAIVLDPFCGSGTVGRVAKKLGRKAILIDISEDYCHMAQQRVKTVSLPLEYSSLSEAPS